jgi:rare lipoprotein A
MKTILLIATTLLLTTSSPIPHIATWYDFHGRRTASGARMHRDSLTAAYNSVPFGTRLEITNSTTGKRCTVTVNDRMGIHSTNRIDLSWAAFGSIASHSKGRITVTVKKLP